LEDLNEAGFPAFKGNKLPGQPDLVVPDTEPHQVTGEVRVIQRKDKKKRFKEFGSEARDAEEHFPDAKFVVVVNMGRYLEEVDRESLRDEIHEASGGGIDRVYFQDEMKLLISELEEWGITRQQRLNGDD
jgi:hypothetical protein